MPSLAPDISEELGGDIGLPTTPPISVPPSSPTSMRWDCEIGGLPFLFSMSDQFPYRRETADFRRQRIDTERNPGEQSLDSGFWLRSQSSWHYGSGLTSAEPLEVSESEAQFRYVRGGGIDPWTPGQVSLLNDVEKKFPSTGTGQLLIGVDTGVLHADATTVSYISTSASSSVSWGGSASAITSMTSDGTNYYIANAVGIYKGALPSGAGSKIWDTGSSTVIRWVKSRLMATVGKAVYELTGSGPSLPTALDAGTTRPSGWTWTDMAEGPSAIYLSGYAGDTSTIEKINVTVTSGTVTLDPPTVVADMPRGEQVLNLYAYVGSFLIVGTNKGCRVAAIGNDGGLSLGPLLFETVDGCQDAVAVGSFVYVTVGSKGSAGNRSERAGLWRINLATNLNQSPLQFASAADLVCPAGLTGACHQVTTAGGKLWFTVTGTSGGIFRQNDTYVADGWLETGRIRLGTLEAKAWRELRLTCQPNSPGAVRGYANLSDVSKPSTWTLTTSVDGTNYDVSGSLNSVAPNRQGAIYAAILLSTTNTSETPVFTGYQVKAVPSPIRSELVQVPVLMFDFETDRNGGRYGKRGGAWERFAHLKELEAAASVVEWLDHTTGERAEASIERVVLVRLTPPSRGFSGAGGVCQVLLRLL